MYLSNVEKSAKQAQHSYPHTHVNPEDIVNQC